MSRGELAQLRMVFSELSTVIQPTVPSGYSLRTYQEGDDRVWVRLLNTGNFGSWDITRLERMKAGERAPLPLDGVFFVTADDKLVGTACIFLYRDARGEYSEYGWLVVDPAHRGNGLGGTLTQAALFFAREASHRYVFLKTEDDRLAAIKTYLKLGFEPEIVDPSHATRWEHLWEVLHLSGSACSSGTSKV